MIYTEFTKNTITKVNNNLEMTEESKAIEIGVKISKNNRMIEMIEKRIEKTDPNTSEYSRLNDLLLFYKENNEELLYKKSVLINNEYLRIKESRK